MNIFYFLYSFLFVSFNSTFQTYLSCNFSHAYQISEAIVEEEEDNAVTERNLDEIDEQLWVQRTVSQMVYELMTEISRKFCFCLKLIVA